ncbi:MAG TPA: glyceraldehyde 3-phosphate dehydrogenase NAD-binding domain-containing protein [Methylomirabilota bacterium]|jgi:glyceraldehyde 3-phosphate dehydrogenase|nr:glyceraldehyde 3-phosphate dehydrogenase NAD-binding domain-containing protein [Methylomirabilota bacterium]
MTRIAINGLGRVGRAAFKQIMEDGELEVVAVNDLAPVEELAYLLGHDSVYGRYGRDVRAESGRLVVDGRSCVALSEESLDKLPWRDLGVAVVLECTGVFTRQADLERHVDAGAKFVILSAPVEGGDVPAIVHGVNRAERGARIVSCTSCTTNCITPVIEILGRRLGILKATMTTTHAYTASQALVDRPDRDRRRGRAAATNLVPSTTGAAKATIRVLPEYQGKFDGVAIRAPVPVGSIADIVCLVARPTSVDEVNRLFREEASSSRYRGIVGVSDEALVSADIIQDPRASIIDCSLTQVVDGDLVKVMSWYDNEWGYAAQLVREAKAVGRTRPEG